MGYHEEDEFEDLCEEIEDELGTAYAEEARELFEAGWDIEDIRDRLDF